MFNKLITCLLLSIPMLSYAEQRLFIQEGGNVTANISASSLNRIAVQGDRIANVKGMTGQFQLEKDLNLGQVFIQPNSPEDKAPIHIYITTEQGKTYSLTLLSNDMPAENIVLVSNSVQDKEISWEKTSSYETTIVNIIKAMHNDAPLEGFYSSQKAKNDYQIPGLSISSRHAYLGSKLQGHSYEIKNEMDDDVTLNTSDFYKSGIRAISILNKSLSPQSKTTVYVVRGN